MAMLFERSFVLAWSCTTRVFLLTTGVPLGYSYFIDMIHWIENGINISRAEIESAVLIIHWRVPENILNIEK